MNRAIELHDSVITGAVAIDGDVVVVFSHVYIHESTGEPGVAPGIGLTSLARLRILQGQVRQVADGWPVIIAEGELALGGRVYSNLMPMEIDFRGAVRFLVTGHSNDVRSACQQIEINGQGAVLELTDNVRQIDVFPGVD